jgi:hypothetical protein
MIHCAFGFHFFGENLLTNLVRSPAAKAAMDRKDFAGRDFFLNAGSRPSG